MIMLYCLPSTSTVIILLLDPSPSPFTIPILIRVSLLASQYIIVKDREGIPAATRYEATKLSYKHGRRQHSTLGLRSLELCVVRCPVNDQWSLSIVIGTANATTLLTRSQNSGCCWC